MTDWGPDVSFKCHRWPGWEGIDFNAFGGQGYEVSQMSPVTANVVSCPPTSACACRHFHPPAPPGTDFMSARPEAGEGPPEILARAVALSGAFHPVYSVSAGSEDDLGYLKGVCGLFGAERIWEISGWVHAWLYVKVVREDGEWFKPFPFGGLWLYRPINKRDLMAGVYRYVQGRLKEEKQ